ncbi:MAG: protein kinase [Rhodocyclaceae bacterium]|nr:protein kinase [Rhodocyclaceae bacterium]MCE2980270.1 protein kinase [Betaproteobacteria bacterium]MCA3073823.1 protein kinase [Rhodocyclaceae bacterium]MCA3091806.1 protein kinase [Rhodocyclaceae bacterium]MCA3093300.1 protein kinase [Rhodocyclaceae bacterium]
MREDFPKKIGKYRILRELGRGATSSVFLATDPFGDREVAIKLFTCTDSADVRMARRYRNMYLNEATLAGKLLHPYITTIFDAVDDEDASYIVMEYVPGGTLEYYANVARLLPVERVIEVVFKCAQALFFAQQRGVIHRDIKPANILGHADTLFKVSDFGSALSMTAENTQINGIGSPAYMSPEQVRDEPLTHQTDIYSLGVVLYQLLTGKLPFAGGSHASLVYQILNIEAVKPSEAREGLSPDLDRITMRAMAKDAALRYATWQEFADDLSRVVGSLALPQSDLNDAVKFAAIKALSFFREFADVEIWEALHVTRWWRAAASTVLIREGEQGDSFFILAEGEVRVSRGGTTLNILAPGDCFGEMLYFSAPVARRTTSITTLTPTMVIEIKASSLNTASDALQVKMNRAFLRILLDRLTLANARLASA